MCPSVSRRVLQIDLIYYTSALCSEEVLQELLDLLRLFLEVLSLFEGIQLGSLHRHQLLHLEFVLLLLLHLLADFSQVVHAGSPQLKLFYALAALFELLLFILYPVVQLPLSIEHILVEFLLLLANLVLSLPQLPHPCLHSLMVVGTGHLHPPPIRKPQLLASLLLPLQLYLLRHPPLHPRLIEDLLQSLCLIQLL